jgi:hypothetical protein
MIIILNEIYQFLYILSTTYLISIIADLLIKMYGRFKLKHESRFQLNYYEKILLWISIAIFFTYTI